MQGSGLRRKGDLWLDVRSGRSNAERLDQNLSMGDAGLAYNPNQA